MREIDIENAKIAFNNAMVEIINKYNIPFGVAELMLRDMTYQIISFKNAEMQKEQLNDKEVKDNVQDKK